MEPADVYIFVVIILKHSAARCLLLYLLFLESQVSRYNSRQHYSSPRSLENDQSWFLAGLENDTERPLLFSVYIVQQCSACLLEFR